MEVKLTGQGPWALHPDGSVTAAPAPGASPGDGDADAAASDVTLVFTPGHTRGHVCLYHSPTKVRSPSHHSQVVFMFSLWPRPQRCPCPSIVDLALHGEAHVELHPTFRVAACHDFTHIIALRSACQISCAKPGNPPSLGPTQSLLSGDHLCSADGDIPGAPQDQLHVFTDFNWYSVPQQLDSVAALLQYDWLHVLPGGWDGVPWVGGVGAVRAVKLVG